MRTTLLRKAHTAHVSIFALACALAGCALEPSSSTSTSPAPNATVAARAPAVAGAAQRNRTLDARVLPPSMRRVASTLTQKSAGATMHTVSESPPTTATMPPPSTVWAKGFLTTADAVAEALVVDHHQNIIIGGYFSGDTNFGCGSMPIGDASFAMFVAKFDGTGNCLWSKSAAGTGAAAVAYALGVDDGDNVYVTGSFSGTTSFSGTPLTTAGGLDGFVAGYAAADGTLTWANRFGSSRDDDAGYGLAAQGARVVVAGSFTGSADFPDATNPKTLSSNGDSDMFVATYGASGGALLTLSGFGSAHYDAINGVTLDASGNIYVAGSFSDAFPLGSTATASQGGLDGFIAQLSAEGTYLTGRTFGSASDDEAVFVNLDLQGNVLATGYVGGSAALGENGSGTITVPPSSTWASFAAKFAVGADGIAYVWASPITGDTIAVIGGVYADSSGNTFVTGAFDGAGVVAGYPLSSHGKLDAFVAILDGTGATTWAQAYGGAGDDYAYATGVSGTQLVVDGAFEQTVDLGKGPMDSLGGANGFLMSLASN